MSGRPQKKVLEEALALPPEERADLAATLLDSLDEQEDEGVEQAWAEEIERRIQEVESGHVKMIPWSEARRRLRARLECRPPTLTVSWKSRLVARAAYVRSGLSPRRHARRHRR